MFRRDVQIAIAEMAEQTAADAGTVTLQHMFFRNIEAMEYSMDKQRIEGGAKKVTGTIKEKVGQMVGDRHTEAEGRAEKTEGRVRSAVGQAKDAARELVGKK